MHMGWIRDAIVCLFNAAIWEAGYRGGIPLADMPALSGWMARGWVDEGYGYMSPEAHARREAFARHLDEATRIVNSWPEWKRNILG